MSDCATERRVRVSQSTGETRNRRCGGRTCRRTPATTVQRIEKNPIAGSTVAAPNANGDSVTTIATSGTVAMLSPNARAIRSHRSMPREASTGLSIRERSSPFDSTPAPSRLAVGEAPSSGKRAETNAYPGTNRTNGRPTRIRSGDSLNAGKKTNAWATATATRTPRRSAGTLRRRSRDRTVVIVGVRSRRGAR